MLLNNGKTEKKILNRPLPLAWYDFLKYEQGIILTYGVLNVESLEGLLS